MVYAFEYEYSSFVFCCDTYDSIICHLDLWPSTGIRKMLSGNWLNFTAHLLMTRNYDSPLEVMSERVLYLAVSGNRENYLGTWGQSLKENIKEKSKINVESEITLTDTYFRLCFTHSLT